MLKPNDLKTPQREALLNALKTRFEKHVNRHKGLEWAKVQARLEADAAKLWSLHEMALRAGSRLDYCLMLNKARL